MQNKYKTGRIRSDNRAKIIAIAQESFNCCAANGDSDLDHSAMVTALEKMASHQLDN